jgi:hypothetical protein
MKTKSSILFNQILIIIILVSLIVSILPSTPAAARVEPSLRVYAYPKSDIRTIVDGNTVVFNRWGGESQFAMSILEGLDGKFSAVPTPVIEGWNDYGGMDIFVTLDKRPVGNQIIFSTFGQNIDLFLQPPLTEQEIAEGHGRPDHVVNSIALYHPYKQGDYTAMGGNNYQSGKFGHLYRMKAIDAKKNWAWTDWGVETGEVTLTIPQSFLDTATYPITIAPPADPFG